MAYKRMHSNALEGAAYDPLAKALYVFFKRGSAYRYAQVPESVYLGLVDAHSKGQFYQAEIRNRFGYERLPAAEAERVRARVDLPGGEGRAWVKQFLEEARAEASARAATWLRWRTWRWC